MIASAAWPRENPEQERLLWIEPERDAFADSRIGDLASIVRRGDLLVVNDAATLPASLRGLREDGTPFELRLLAREAVERTPHGNGVLEGSTRWRAVVFGRGDWRQRTEDRPAPPRLREGERVRVAGGAVARVVSLDVASPRLLRIAFEGDAASMWRAIYGEGRPVQYSYVDAPLALWHVQSSFAARPWAVEPPSAGRPLTFSVLERLRARGVGVVALTHAAGLSSTGDPALDAILPLEERYDVPAATVAAINAARASGGRVVAVGTTVVRALEGCAAAHGGELVAGEGSTDLRLHARSKLRVASGLLTGIHEPGTTHFYLLQSFVAQPLLARALRHAERAGYLQHEFGDSILILARGELPGAAGR
jgi:S-adenosylmethionine:tRNA ribosyltransferase-isomerase